VSAGAPEAIELLTALLGDEIPISYGPHSRMFNHFFRKSDFGSVGQKHMKPDSVEMQPTTCVREKAELQTRPNALTIGNGTKLPKSSKQLRRRLNARGFIHLIRHIDRFFRKSNRRRRVAAERATPYAGCCPSRRARLLFIHLIRHTDGFCRKCLIQRGVRDAFPVGSKTNIRDKKLGTGGYGVTAAPALSLGIRYRTSAGCCGFRGARLAGSKTARS
jgi:hypothetical protein